MKPSEDMRQGASPVLLPVTKPQPKAAGDTVRGPRSPFKIVDLYLFGQVVQATIRGLGWFCGLLVAVTVITAVRKLVDSSLVVSSMALWIVYQIPRIMLFTLPMSVLFGTVQTFIDLSAHGEATALFAGGMSLRRMLVAPLAWGAILAVTSFILQERIMPACEQQKQDIAARSMATAKVQEHFRYEDPPAGRGPLKRIIQAASFDPKNGTLIKPRIQEFDADHRLSIEITADRAVWNFKSGEWDFFVVKGVAPNHQGKPGEDSFRTIDQPYVHYKEIDPDKLSAATMTLQQHLEHGDFEMASFTDLYQYRESMQQQIQAGKATTGAMPPQQFVNAITFGMHDKIATPLVCLALVLIGVPLGLRPQRSASSGVAMGLSLVVLLGYYIVYVWTQTVGGAGASNPMVMAYVALIVTTLTGCGLVWWKEK